MLKISKLESLNHSVTLRLEGRVVGPWVEELQHACEQALADDRILKLDLAELEFMDAAAVAFLSGLRSRGVELLECPPFVLEQLKANAGARNADSTLP